MLGLGDSEGAKGVGLEGLTGELGKAKAPEWKSSFDGRASSARICIRIDYIAPESPFSERRRNQGAGMKLEGTSWQLAPEFSGGESSRVRGCPGQLYNREAPFFRSFAFESSAFVREMVMISIEPKL